MGQSWRSLLVIVARYKFQSLRFKCTTQPPLPPKMPRNVVNMHAIKFNICSGISWKSDWNTKKQLHPLSRFVFERWKPFTDSEEDKVSTPTIQKFKGTPWPAVIIVQGIWNQVYIKRHLPSPKCHLWISGHKVNSWLTKVSPQMVQFYSPWLEQWSPDLKTWQIVMELCNTFSFL